VRYFADVEKVRPVGDWPKDLVKERRYGEFSVGFKETLTIAPWESVLVESVLQGKSARDRYMELDDALLEIEEDDERSLLLGHPCQIQGDMSVECSVVSGGIYAGDAKASKHPKYKQLAARAIDWRLLLQVHSIEKAGMCWGDLGCLYFWIREQDLKDHRFESSWMVLQCG